jgi:hypothetical protein
MLRIALAAALAAYVVYDATSASGLTWTAETASHPLLARSDRVLLPSAQADCPDVVWPYYPSECLKSPLQRRVRFVTTDRFPASGQAMSLAQLERP